jgi:hypothetical protein
MPRVGELPPSLAKLVRRQALELSPNRFDTDIQRLLRALDRTIAETRDQARHDAEEAAARQGQVEQLQGRLRERAAVRDWQAVLAASGELAVLDPAAADPDGLASAAREQLARRREAEEAAAAQRQVEQLQGQLRERAAVQDWQAVVAASRELAVLDPAAADPDGLASAAREQIARRREAEEKARREAEEKARREAEEKARRSLGADLRSAAIRATPTPTVKSSGDQPEWTANLTSSYASTRHIVITLSHERHTLDVAASNTRPSIMLDGTAVARKNFSIGYKNPGIGYRKRTFSIPDGRELRKAEVWCDSAITKLKIIVDGRVLYEEGLTDTGVGVPFKD